MPWRIMFINPDHIRERLLLLSVEGAGLEFLAVGDVLCFVIKPLEKLTQESCGTESTAINRFSDAWLNDGEHVADERA